MSIIIKNLTHIYNKKGPYEKAALDNINLTIDDGEFVGIIGHTGSGKSTLIQHLNALIKPTFGTVFYNGEDVFSKGYDTKALRKDIGLVFQYPEYQLFEETVFKDIAYGLKNYNVPENMHQKLVKDAILKVGLNEDILDKSPFELSGGQKRRVAIAGVLAMEPKVLILDEPAAGLDPVGRKQILDEIKELHQKGGITVILVSHSMEDIARYADRIIVMEKGKAVMDKAPKDIFKERDKLIDMGLDIPEITKIMSGLKKRGYDVPLDVFDASDAAKIIYNLLKGEENA